MNTNPVPQATVTYVLALNRHPCLGSVPVPRPPRAVRRMGSRRYDRSREENDNLIRI